MLHLLLSHKRSGVLAKGMVQALGADVPLGSTEVAGEAAVMQAGACVARFARFARVCCAVLHAIRRASLPFFLRP